MRNEHSGVSTLEELRAELSELTRWRFDTVQRCRAEIAAANKHYDAQAIQLARAIRRLEPKPNVESVPESKPTPTTRRKRQPRFSLDGMEDWTPEEIAHYKRLKGVAV